MEPWSGVSHLGWLSPSARERKRRVRQSRGNREGKESLMAVEFDGLKSECGGEGERELIFIYMADIVLLWVVGWNGWENVL